MHCGKCGAVVAEEKDKCQQCGADLNKAEEKTVKKTDDDTKKPRKKKSKIKLIILITVLVLVVATVATLVTLQLVYLNQPIVKLSKAFEKTVFESSSISVRTTVNNFLLKGDLSATADFGKGLDGSTFEGVYKGKRKDQTISVKNGVVYINGKEKTTIDEFIKEAKNSDNENEKIAAAFLEVLDKSINGRIDSEAFNTLMQEEFIPYYEKVKGTDLPESEESGEAFEKVITECSERGAIVLTEIESENADLYNLEVDATAVVNCVFELAKEDATIASFIDMIVNVASGINIPFISIETREDLQGVLLELVKDSKPELTVAVKNGRIAEIKTADGFAVLIGTKEYKE